LSSRIHHRNRRRHPRDEVASDTGHSMVSSLPPIPVTGENFDTLVRGGMAAFSDTRQAPGHVTHAAVLHLAREISASLETR